MTGIDTLIFSWINLNAQTPGLVLGLARLASLDLPRYLLAGTLAIALAGRAPWRNQALRALLAMALAALAAHLIKYTVHLPRPFMLGIGDTWLPHASTPGFPSAHTSVASAFAVSIMLAPGAHWLVRVVLVVLAGLVAWSRIALGLHFPSDVLAAMLLGSLCALLAQSIKVFTSRARRSEAQ